MMSPPLDKKRIARCFLQAATTYDGQAGVQRRISARLLTLAGQVPAIRYDRVLEIGCCTGAMTRLLCEQHQVGTLFLNDLVPEFQDVVAARLPPDRMPCVQSFFGDIESLALPERLTLVLSSSTFQWLTDLPRFFHTLARALQADAFLVFSLFCKGTLAEFTELTGVGLDYRSPEQIAGLLENDFVLEQIRCDQDRLLFPTPRAVLHHLRDTGVGGVRQYQWKPSTLRRFEEEYRGRFGVDGGVPVTYVSVSCIARKK